MAYEVHVEREWDRLAEAVVGRAVDFTFPADMSRLGQLAFLPAELAGRVGELAGRRWSQAAPEWFARSVEQLDALAGFLERRGTTVHRPRPLTAAEQRIHEEFAPLSLQHFVRDPMIVIGDRVIEASLRMPHRAKERYGLRPLLRDLTARGARHVVVPPGRPAPLDELAAAEGPWLEGGDVLLCGTDVLVGVGQGRYATDEAGVAWLRELLGEGHRVHPVPLHPRVLHLDDGLSLPHEGLAVVAREQFTAGLPAPLADWDLIEVTLHEALELLAANMLVLEPGEVVLDSRVPHLAEALTRHGVTVHPFDFDAITPFGGGFRCSHHPVRRERGRA